MLGLAFEGITSLSIKPISMIVSLGFVVSAFSFIGIIWAIVMAIMGHAITGWASMTCIVCFLGGIQLLSLGIIGQYVGKHIWRQNIDRDILLARKHMKVTVVN